MLKGVCQRILGVAYSCFVFYVRNEAVVGLTLRVLIFEIGVSVSPAGATTYLGQQESLTLVMPSTAVEPAKRVASVITNILQVPCIKCCTRLADKALLYLAASAGPAKKLIICQISCCLAKFNDSARIKTTAVNSQLTCVCRKTCGHVTGRVLARMHTYNYLSTA